MDDVDKAILRNIYLKMTLFGGRVRLKNMRLLTHYLILILNKNFDFYLALVNHY